MGPADLPRDGMALATSAENDARRTRDPKRRAELWLDAGEAWLEVDRHDDVERVLRLARKAHSSGSTAARHNRLRGRLHLGRGEVALAERYLLKGLDGAEGEERERTIARLVVCARAQGDAESEARYRRLLRDPGDPQIALILAREVERVPIAARSSYLESLYRESTPVFEPAVPPPAPRATPEPRRAAFVAVEAVPRSRWQPRPVSPSKLVAMKNIRRITVHHTAGPSFWGHDERSVANEIRRIQRYHQKEQGWADIGYHFLIDRTGRIWQGRDLRLQGAHARDHNDGNIGIALLGNYTRQDMTAAQRESLRKFILALSAHYEIPAQQVFTHGEICNGETACPGQSIARFVQEVRSDVRDARALAYGK
ncbi:MAG TPA: N-acetylmuramoyl-L-alanine amidase [Planctomycetota bacterium]|nr:N-acetylmuramoyl-L-alanine amidase [Planctomycetota bacterium]